eukprot:2286452-Amphidinium_carterae.1
MQKLQTRSLCVGAPSQSQQAREEMSGHKRLDNPGVEYGFGQYGGSLAPTTKKPRHAHRGQMRR